MLNNTLEFAMKHAITRVAIALSSVLAAGYAVADQTTDKLGIRNLSPSRVAMSGATVHLSPETTLENATVLVHRGKIEKILKNGEVPAGYRVIDLKGHHLYAGFIEPYSEYGLPAGKEAAGGWGAPPVYYNKRTGGNSGNDAIHPETDWVEQFKADKKSAKALRKQGFTATQTVSRDGIFRGQGLVVSLGNGLPNDTIYRAHGAHFMSFKKGSSKQSYPSSLMGSVALVRQTLSDAQWYAQAEGKSDLRYFQQRVEFNAALEEGAAELFSAPVIFETEDDQDLFMAQGVLADYQLDANFVASGYEYTRGSDLAALKKPLIVPLDFPSKPNIAALGNELDVGLDELRHWERAASNPSALVSAGLPIAFTTYRLAQPKEFWSRIRQSVAAGLSKKDALAALTTVPAQIAGVDSFLGKIAPGYMADFTVTTGDVFDGGKIAAVMTQGKLHKFMPLNPVQLSGTYAVEFDGATKAELTLSCKPKGKLSGSMSVGEKTLKLTQGKCTASSFNFAIALPEEQGSRVQRFKGMLRNKTWELAYEDAQGALQQALFASVKLEDKMAKSKSLEAPEYVSTLTYPLNAFAPTQAPEAENFHIKNATIWTSDKQGVLKNADLLVKNGKIFKVGKSLKTPRGFIEIDGTGKHVTPGIIDEHSHIAVRGGVNESSVAVTSEVRIGDALNAEDFAIYRGLAGGVTSAQLLHGSANPIGGQAQIIKLRWGQDADGLRFNEAPPSIKFALGENVKQSNWGDNFTQRYPQTRIGVDTVMRDSFQAAKEYKADWKAYEDLSRRRKKDVVPPRRDFRLEALVEILDGKRFIHTHSYVASEILNLMRVADDMGFKVHTFTHILEGYKVAEEMAKHGAGASTFADWWAYKFEVYDAIPGNTCLMKDKGVLVSINSDSPDLQRHLNQEAAKSMRYCGMSAEDALKMITINPAKQLNVDKYVGSITKGKQADLVLWDTNPLSVYAQPISTWIDGARYFDLAEDRKLREQQQAEHLALIQKVLASDMPSPKKATGQFKKKQPVWHCDDNHGYGFLDLGHHHQHAAH